MKRLLLILLLVFSVGVFAPINAMDRRIAVPCPLGGKNAQGIEVLGFRLRDSGLDGRPYGAHVAPNPPPECPDNGFFVYKKKFSEAELAQLKQYIFSDEYQKMWRNEAPAHYRLAKIYEYAGIPRSYLTRLYLIATWEVPPWNEELYLYYAHAAIEAIEVAISEMGPHAELKTIVQYQYVLAALYRRVGDFDHARQQLDRVKQTDHNQVFIEAVFINYLDYLISNKDSDSHKMSEAEEALGS